MEFDMGFALMDRLFPLMFLVVFIFIISTIVGSLVSGAKRKHKNDQSPRVTADAKVVSKRMPVGQNRQSSGDNDMMRSYTYSKYFVTFEFESGDRLELPVDGSDYGLLSTPGDLKNVLSVGAADKDGNVADFSSVGPLSDLSFGEKVYARGVGVLSADNEIGRASCRERV